MSVNAISPYQPVNKGVPGAAFYVPATNPPAGALLSKEKYPQNGEKEAKLFEPLKIRGVTFKNRIWVSPMCEYSCPTGTGLATEWHLAHLGAFATRGAGLVMTEATAVTSNGRISPQDLGIWTDDHIEPLRRVAQYIKSQGTVPGIQLAHAGRKASTLAPWLLVEPTPRPDPSPYPLSSFLVPKEEGGFGDDLWSASAIPYDDKHGMPKEMTREQIKYLIKSFGDAAKRSIEAGFEVIQIHGGHGYIFSTFLSPVSNTRTDEYGGSLENRCRLTVETLKEVRRVWGDRPLFFRLSCTEWHPDGEKSPTGEWISWGQEQSAYLSRVLREEAQIDMLDASSSGNYSGQVFPFPPPKGVHVPFAEQIKKEVGNETGLLCSTVGWIDEGKQAEEIVASGKADAVFIAREFLRHADLVFDWAQELGVVVSVPAQYARSQVKMINGHLGFTLDPFSELTSFCLWRVTRR